MAFFDCGVSFHGNSPPEISWKHGSSDLNFTLSFENETYALARMSLIASEEDDGNVYICHVNFPTVHNGYICQTLPKLKVYCEYSLVNCKPITIEFVRFASKMYSGIFIAHFDIMLNIKGPSLLNVFGRKLWLQVPVMYL